MTNLTEILELLDEDTIIQKINNPIDEIFNQVYLLTEQIISKRKLISIIYYLIEQLKKNKIILKINNDRFSELVWFLNQYYSSDGSQGYEKAIFEINNYKKEGIYLILEAISESLKIENKEKYLQWIYKSKIEHSTWVLKLEIVEQIDKASRNSSLTHHLNKFQKALYLKELIQQQLESNQSIKSMLKPKSF